MNDGRFTNNSWLSCNNHECTVNNCPGKNFRAGDVARCPDNIFYLHKVIPGTNRRESGVVRAGNSIILERRAGSRLRSKFLYCNQETQVCHLSNVCVVRGREYNDVSFCREHVLIVRAEGKNDTEPITHRDHIGFQFRTDHDPEFHRQCAFGCNPITKTCTKELCVHLGSNALDAVSTPEDAPKCGKDVFSIHKY